MSEKDEAYKNTIRFVEFRYGRATAKQIAKIDRIEQAKRERKKKK